MSKIASSVLAKFPPPRIADMMQSVCKSLSAVHTADRSVQTLLAGLWLVTRLKSQFRGANLSASSYKELALHTHEAYQRVKQSEGALIWTRSLGSWLTSISMTKMSLQSQQQKVFVSVGLQKPQTQVVG